MYLKTLAQYGRHFRIIQGHMTLKKVYNLCKLFIQYLAGKQVITTMPALLKVEASRKCLVNCTYCFAERANKFFPKRTYFELLDKLHPWIFEVSLYNIGEPLWCEDLIEFIAYAHQRNVSTALSTSLSLEKDEQYWDNLVLAGLDYMVVALDGTTAEVYNKYRVNGNFPLVMKNLHSILRAKKQHNSQITIEWQMIEFEWNRHEIAEARRMAGELGMVFRLIKEAKLPREDAQKKAAYIRKRNCLLPYLVYMVNSYGEVTPCCKYFGPEMKIGDGFENSFEENWNNEAIRQVRDSELIKSRPICCKCNE